MLPRLVNEPSIVIIPAHKLVLVYWCQKKKSNSGKFLQKRIYEIQVAASRAHTYTHTHIQSAQPFNALESDRDQKNVYFVQSPRNILERRKIAVHEKILQLSHGYY